MDHIQDMTPQSNCLPTEFFFISRTAENFYDMVADFMYSYKVTEFPLTLVNTSCGCK